MVKNRNKSNLTVQRQSNMRGSFRSIPSATGTNDKTIDASAAAFGGTLNGSGMVHSLTEAFAKFITGRKSIVTATVGTGLFCNMTTGDQFLSIILTSNLYKKLYEEKGFEARLLSRTTEDACTVTSVLIPWNSCGMTQSTVLKVATVEYLPYCIFNLISPLMSIMVAALGYKIVRGQGPRPLSSRPSGEGSRE